MHPRHVISIQRMSRRMREETERRRMTKEAGENVPIAKSACGMRRAGHASFVFRRTSRNDTRNNYQQDITDITDRRRFFETCRGLSSVQTVPRCTRLSIVPLAPCTGAFASMRACLLSDISNFDDLRALPKSQSQNLVQDRTRRACKVKSRLRFRGFQSGGKERNVSCEDCNLHNLEKMDKSAWSMQARERFSENRSDPFAGSLRGTEGTA